MEKSAFNTDISSMFYRDTTCKICGAPCRVMNGGFDTCSKRSCFEIEFQNTHNRQLENIRLANLKKSAQ